MVVPRLSYRWKAVSSWRDREGVCVERRQSEGQKPAGGREVCSSLSGMTSSLVFYAVTVLCSVWRVRGQLAGDRGGRSFFWLHLAVLQEEEAKISLGGGCVMGWATRGPGHGT